MRNDMGLRQRHAPTEEPVTLLQAKVYLGIDDDAHDELLGRLIKSARQGAESYTSRSFLRQAWSFSFNGGFAQSRSDTRYLDKEHSRGTGGIELPRSPFVALIDTPVILTSFGETPMPNYRLDTSSRVARIHLPAQVDPQATVRVDFWAGYGETPEDLPEPLRQAVLMTVANLFEGRAVANDTGLIAMPLSAAVIQLLKPYRAQRLFS